MGSAPVPLAVFAVAPLPLKIARPFMGWVIFFDIVSAKFILAKMGGSAIVFSLS